MECKGRLWQLLCNYIQADWINIKAKEKKKEEIKKQNKTKQKETTDNLSMKEWKSTM